MDLLREDHKSLEISWITAFIRRRNDKVLIQYRINGDVSTYYSPRAFSKIFDNQNDDETRVIIRKVTSSFNEKKSRLNRSKSSSKSKGRILRKSQNADTPADDRHYFNTQHFKTQFHISYAKAFIDGNRIRVQYKLVGDKKLFTSPSSLTNWMVGRDLAYINNEIQRWKNFNNENVGSYKTIYPEFFRRHELEFLKFLKVRSSTADGYYRLLGKYIFSFFIGKLDEYNVNRWSDHYVEFRKFLENSGLSSVSINKVYAAMRRYFDFLIWKGEYKFLYDPINEAIKNQGKSQISLPGILPKWQDLYQFILSLPRGRERWVMTLMSSFGLRVSEALAADRYDLLGKTEIEEELRNNDLINGVVSRHKNCFLFLSCKKAYKRDISYDVVRKAIEIDEDPKTGHYYAVCTHLDFANLLIDMINSGEDELGDEVTYDSLVRYLQSNSGTYDVNPEFMFEKWTMHDFRRSSVTLKLIEWNDLKDVGLVHGHKSLTTTERYNQLAIQNRKIWSKGRGLKINL